MYSLQGIPPEGPEELLNYYFKTMKATEIETGYRHLRTDELETTKGGGLIVFAFLAGLALAYYEKRVK